MDFSIHNNPIKSFIELDVVLTNNKNIEEISNTLNKKLKKLNLALTNETINAEAIKTRTTFLKQIEKPHMFGIYNAGLIAENGLEAIIAAFSGNGVYTAGKQLRKFKISGTPQIIIQHPSKSEANTEVAETKIKFFVQYCIDGY